MFPTYSSTDDKLKLVKVLSRNQLEYIVKQCNRFVKIVQATSIAGLPYDVRLDISEMNQFTIKHETVTAEPGCTVRDLPVALVFPDGGN